MYEDNVLLIAVAVLDIRLNRKRNVYWPKYSPNAIWWMLRQNRSPALSTSHHIRVTRQPVKSHRPIRLNFNSNYNPFFRFSIFSLRFLCYSILYNFYFFFFSSSLSFFFVIDLNFQPKVSGSIEEQARRSWSAFIGIPPSSVLVIFLLEMFF